jgi:restriction system protein
MWKITAGRANAFVRRFLDDGVVGIGWVEAGNYTGAKSKADLIKQFSVIWPDHTKRQVEVGSAQVWRFLNEVALDDEVITYDPDERRYHYGRISGNVVFLDESSEHQRVLRKVDWSSFVSRDDLSKSARNSLGAILTIFKVPEQAAEEIRALKDGRSILRTREISDPEVALAEELDPYDGIADQAIERIKDRIRALEWDDMQELVAALLRALGYRTIVSPAGADRGKDIIASRDGFGFERPRIVVEVKHRKEAMGSQEIRSFLGGRHADDRGLYVSTGGFSKEAHYEAERASTVTHLMSLDGLARALVDQYENLDSIGRRLLPLTKLYWPI